MKIPKFLLIVVFILMRIIAIAQIDKKGMRLLEMEQFNQAKSEFRSSLKSINSAENWFYLGKIYATQHLTDSARYCFSKIASADSKSSLNSVGQAISTYLSGNSTQALAILDKSIKSAVSSKEITALVEIAEARVMAGDTLKWTESLDKATSIDKKDIRPYLVAGNLYYGMSEKSQKALNVGLAAGRYQQVLYLQPDNLEALSKLAGIYIKIKNYTDCETMLNKILAKDPEYIPALKMLGELYYTIGRYQEASDTYGKYIELAENSEKDIMRYITILYFNKEYAKATVYINKELLASPTNPILLRLKGYTAYELKQNEEGLLAMKSFFAVRSVVDTNKVIASDYEYYGKLLSRVGSDSLAILNFVKAQEMDSAEIGLSEEIARLYEKQKKFPEAIENYEKLIRAKNNNVSSLVFFNLGKDYLVLASNVKGTPDSLIATEYLVKADSAFTKVVETSPNSYLGYHWRARALAGLDPETLLGLAKSDYEKSISILESKNDTKKYGSDLVEAYRYLGYYYYLQYDGLKKSPDAEAKNKAKDDSTMYWQKVLEIDPLNDIAKQALSALK